MMGRLIKIGIIFKFLFRRIPEPPDDDTSKRVHSFCFMAAAPRPAVSDAFSPHRIFFVDFVAQRVIVIVLYNAK